MIAHMHNASFPAKIITALIVAISKDPCYFNPSLLSDFGTRVTDRDAMNEKLARNPR